MRTLKRAARRARAGLTLLELAIAAVIVAMMFGAVAITVLRADGAYREAELGAEVERDSERALERVAREFMDAARTSVTLTPAAPLQGTSISYRRATGWGGGALQLSPTRRIRFELDAAELADGLDNDGDGLADEGRVVLATDVVGGGTQAVLVTGVAALTQGELDNGADDNGDGRIDEPGFFADFDAATSTLFLSLTLATRADDGRVVTRAARLSVRIRNG